MPHRPPGWSLRVSLCLWKQRKEALRLRDETERYRDLIDAERKVYKSTTDHITVMKQKILHQRKIMGKGLSLPPELVPCLRAISQPPPLSLPSLPRPSNQAE